MIALEGFSVTFNNEDVLAPVSSSLKLTRNPGCIIGDKPQYDVELALNDVRASIESRALRGSTKLIDALSLAARRQKLLDQHPYYLLGSAARPITSSNARCWWRYAARLACPALDAKRRASEALLGFSQCAHERRTYLEALRNEDRATMRRIERQAPFEALRMWRRDDVVATVERERAEARKAETQQRSSWFSWRRSSKTEDAFEDDGLHLTKKGYAELAKLIYPVCRAAMKRCRPSKKTAPPKAAPTPTPKKEAAPTPKTAPAPDATPAMKKLQAAYS